MSITFNPKYSLGFNSLDPLDGSNCYLRCLEAYLLSKGVQTQELAMGLLCPLDFRLAYTQDFDEQEQRKEWWLILPRYYFTQLYNFGAVTCKWEKPDRENFLQHLPSLLAQSPVLLLPDEYHVPWHPQFHHKHVRVHTLMITEMQDEQLLILDTDADSKDNFLRYITSSEPWFIKSIAKFGALYYDSGWREKWEDFFLRTLQKSQTQLSSDIPALRTFANAWIEDFQEKYYPTLQATFLTIIQPVLFIYMKLFEDGPSICQLLPHQTIVHLHDMVMISYQQMADAAEHFHRTGEPVHHAIAAQALRSFLDLSEKLLDDILAIRI